ncbi:MULTISPECIES: hypothetical protein [unclassified Bradyrhizobium]|uniref:hypothetical protein n=1 Tax=unclassified Bradyrhizobium TaxID=2631580 RepID=UPI003399D81D
MINFFNVSQSFGGSWGSWREVFHCSMGDRDSGAQFSSVELVIGRPQCDHLQLGAF